MANDSDGTRLGVSASGAGDVSISRALRNRHVYVIGKTRTGKTTALLNLVAQDIENDNGFAYIDPAGDAAEAILRLIPPSLVPSTVYLNAADAEHPLAFNVLDLPYPPHKLTEDLIAVFRNLSGGDSWGPRMEHLLRQALFTLLLADGRPYTIADVRRLLTDEDWRARIVAGVPDEETRQFWRTEFTDMPAAAAGPILNKLSGFLLPGSPLRAMLTSKKNRLDIRGFMDGGALLVVNLAKGTLGDEPARLLGGLLVTAIQQEALARASRPAGERRDFYLYVDEFQNFAVPSFGTILSESAKYRLNLTLAHQTLAQVPSELYGLITGNVGTMLAFQVSGDDARSLMREFRGTVWETPRIKAYEVRPLPNDAWGSYIGQKFAGGGTVRLTPDFLRTTFVPHINERIALVREMRAATVKTESLPPRPTFGNYRARTRYKAVNAAMFLGARLRWRHKKRSLERNQPRFQRHDIVTGRTYTERIRVPTEEEKDRESNAKVERYERLIAGIETEAPSPALFAAITEVLPSLQFGFDLADARPSQFPETDDLVNLEPYTAFLRTERAGNVQLIRTLAPPRLADGIAPVPDKIREHSIATYGPQPLTETAAVPTLPIQDDFLAYEEPRDSSPIPHAVEARPARPKRAKARRGKAAPGRESS